MKENNEENLERIAKHVPDSGQRDSFGKLVAMSGNVDLDELLAQIDESDYSVQDWVEALLSFDFWLGEQSINERDFAAMSGYLHCCQMMLSDNVEKPNLEVFVGQCLSDYGFDSASDCQK